MDDKPPVLRDSPYPRLDLPFRCTRCGLFLDETGYCESCGRKRRMLIGVIGYFALPAIGAMACLRSISDPNLPVLIAVAGWLVFVGPLFAAIYFVTYPRPRQHPNSRYVTSDGRCVSCGDPMGDSIRCPRCTPRGVSVLTSLLAIGIPLIGLWMLFSDLSSGAPGSIFGDFAIVLLVFGPIAALMRYLFVGR